MGCHAEVLQAQLARGPCPECARTTALAGDPSHDSPNEVVHLHKEEVTPTMQWAMDYLTTKCIEQLLRHGADPMQEGDAGLMVATEDSRELVYARRRNGVPHIRPMHMATLVGRPDVIHLLVKYGAPVDYEDDVVSTALLELVARTFC